MITFLFLLYILGAFLAFGTSTYIEYREEIKHAKTIQPSISNPWESGIVKLATLFSWIGLIMSVTLCLQQYKQIGFKLNLKEPWRVWEENKL